jgi:hypothetical protein
LAENSTKPTKFPDGPVFQQLLNPVTPFPIYLWEPYRKVDVTEHPIKEDRGDEVSIREFSELDGRRLRETRYHGVYFRLMASLRRKFGKISSDCPADYISEAVCRFFEQCRKRRAFSESGRPVFPYLLKTAERVAFEQAEKGATHLLTRVGVTGRIVVVFLAEL